VDVDRVVQRQAEWIDLLQHVDQVTPEVRASSARLTRELLLLEASDWQFLITTGRLATTPSDGCRALRRGFKAGEIARTLINGAPSRWKAPRRSVACEREDFCFPDLDPPGQPPVAR